MPNTTTESSTDLHFEAALPSGGKVTGIVWQTPDDVWNASIEDWFHATGNTREEAIGNVVKDYTDAH